MKAEDNEFPSVLFDDQTSAPTTPPSGFSRVFSKSDGLYIVDDAGNVTGPFAESTASVAVPWVLASHSGGQQIGVEGVGANNRGLIVPATLLVAATITGIAFRVVNASGNVCVALYDESLARVATSGSVACPAAGARTVDFTAPYVAAAGRYWMGLSCSTTAATFVMAQPSTAFGVVPGSFMDTAHPLPDPFVSAGGGRTPALAGIISGGWTAP